jgi:hypothetical protein
MANPAAISGTLGDVTVASMAASVHKWEIVTESATHEYAVFGDFDRSCVPGKRRHTGTCEFVVVDGTDELNDIEGSPAAAVANATFILTTTKGFTVSLIPDNITLTNDVEGLATGTMSFVVTGVAAYDETA